MLLLGVLFGLMFFSCKPKEDSSFSDQINTVVPKWAIDSVRRNGMILYEGKTPPSFEGFFFQAPHHLTGSNLSGDKIGEEFQEYTYGFLNQNNQALTVDMKGKSENGLDNFIGSGAFVSGNGNHFTVFLESNGKTESFGSVASYQAFQIFSGEITSTGVRNLQNAFILTNKDDPDRILIVSGGCRVFKDSDGFSERTAGFRQSRVSKSTLLSQTMVMSH
ncbi:hypothetical protein C5O19_18650 [Siphonobacter curvatus]|uniref:Uncharacterized protein n=2 Tax=Siphonobacter curvatus TaxID=2094562 RepID=A0A2S7IJ67_9BACT|nr:hypothetical protein C5O19_18650 [Siphonobacter curvatus]